MDDDEVEPDRRVMAVSAGAWLLLCSTLAIYCSACALLERPKACDCTGYPLAPCAPQLSLPLPLPPPACQVCYGTGNPATTFVMLDPSGNLVDFLHCPQFRCGSTELSASCVLVGSGGPVLAAHRLAALPPVQVRCAGCWEVGVGQSLGARWLRHRVVASSNGLPFDSLFLPG